MLHRSCLTSRLDTLGFTLIELLVVVLILGILAAIALPQYQKAVERSKAVQALTLLRAVAQAQKAYFLANGDYAQSFDELAVDIPWPQAATVIGISQDTRANNDWAIEIEDARSAGWSFNVFITRLSGKYDGTGFQLFRLDSREPEIFCFERLDGSTHTVSSSFQAGAYCNKIMKGTLFAENQYGRGYKLP